MLRILIIIIALASTISVDAQTLTKEQLLQDYDYYFSQLEQIHPDPYTAFGGKEAFHQAVRNLRNNLAKRDSLTLDEIKFEGNILLSTLHDGHTNMGWTEIPETMPEACLPLRFRVIPDGIIVNGALPEWKSLIGAYVREVVDGRPSCMLPSTNSLASGSSIPTCRSTMPQNCQICI